MCLAKVLDNMMEYIHIHWIWCLLLASLWYPKGGVSLKLLKISVPQYTLHGEPVNLTCEYDLQHDKLYSVSWYKDHEEIYRYVPKSQPHQHSYAMDGIKVDLKNSNSQVVVLKNVDLKASGLYRCEVSAEAPSFTSVHGEAKMEVVLLPDEDPIISGEERIYQVGDIVNLNCTSGLSYPPARLRWFVNNQQVGPDYEVVVPNHGLMTSVVGLRFQVAPEHFLEGHLKVRCVATITAMPTPSPGPPTPPVPSPVLQHQRLAASAPPHHLDYKETFYFVKGSSCKSRHVEVFLVLTLTAFNIWYNT